MKHICIIIFLILFSSDLVAQDGDQLFDDTFLHEIRISNIDTNFYIDTKEYQDGKIEIDGVIVDSVGIKRKGNISGYYDTNKFGLKIKTNKYISGKKYDGIKEWTLHMNYQDPSMLREKLMYDLCFDLGLFSLRTAFAKVYINDVYWGLFTIVEGKDEMYKHIFDDRDMDAVESLDFGNMCYSNTDVESYFNEDFPSYIVENGIEVTAKNRFVEMLEIANNTADNDYVDIVSNYINLIDFMRYQALNVYLLNFDSYIGFRGNQIYVYDTVQSIWQVTPWDFNASFGLWDTNNHTPDDYPFIPFNISNGCIVGKMNTVSEVRQYYLDAMCELNNMLGDTTSYFDEIDRLANQIRDAVYDDYRKVASNEDFENALGFGYHELFFENQPALRTLITTRNNVIKTGLDDENYSCTVSSNELVEYTSILFPNPTQRYISILNNPLDFKSYNIIDLNGRLLSTGIVSNDIIDMENLSNGIYFIQLIKDNKVETHRVVKVE